MNARHGWQKNMLSRENRTSDARPQAHGRRRTAIGGARPQGVHGRRRRTAAGGARPQEFFCHPCLSFMASLYTVYRTRSKERLGLPPRTTRSPGWKAGLVEAMTSPLKSMPAITGHALATP